MLVQNLQKQLGVLRFDRHLDRGLIPPANRVRGRDEPAVKVPIKSENAQLLLQILDEHLRGRAKPEPEPEGDSLGRIIFERRSASWIGFFVVAIIAAVGGLSLIGLSKMNPGLLLGGVGLL